MSPPFARSHLLGLARTGLAAMAVVASAELAARLWLGPDDDWKFWRMPVGERIDLLEARPEPPDVLFVGDSTAASNLVPETWIATSGFTAYNLGTRGNLLGSFEPTMIDTILPALKNQPRAFVVSFSPHNYGDNAFFEQVASQLNRSLYARSARGELIWGDWFYLARIKHRIRARVPHQSNDPAFDAQHGWQPFETTQAQKRPTARTRVPRAPWSTGASRKRSAAEDADGSDLDEAASNPGREDGDEVEDEVEDEDDVVNREKLKVLERFATLAGDRPVIWILPPAGRRDMVRRQALMAAAPDNVTIWDYSHTKYERAEGAHLGEAAARAFTEAVARRFRQSGVLEK